MQTVIDVPIDTHYHIKKRNVSESDIKIILEAISKGTPFPKEISKNTSFPKEHGWIPVSERLPEDGQEVQITYDAKRKTEKYHVWSAIWDEMHGRFYDKEYRSYICLDYVTAWMPLPTPYKPQESEDKRCR